MIIIMVILWILFTQLSEQGKEKTERLAELRSQDKKLKTTNKELTEKVDGYEKGNGKRTHGQINDPNII